MTTPSSDLRRAIECAIEALGVLSDDGPHEHDPDWDAAHATLTRHLATLEAHRSDEALWVRIGGVMEDMRVSAALFQKHNEPSVVFQLNNYADRLYTILSTYRALKPRRGREAQASGGGEQWDLGK